ncbi:MAG: STAS domain-containing protein [Calothrix sp. MO_192.B10]|nr:STAS domain-containing protein [Calothrix sp. MO_192.B10]
MPAAVNYPQITVIRPLGALNATNTLEFEQELTTALTENGITILLVDLEKVESIDSAGLMVLVAGLKLAQKLGHRLVLSKVSPAVRIILEVTQLDRVFEVFDSQLDLETA